MDSLVILELIQNSFHIPVLVWNTVSIDITHIKMGSSITFKSIKGSWDWNVWEPWLQLIGIHPVRLDGVSAPWSSEATQRKGANLNTFRVLTERSKGQTVPGQVINRSHYRTQCFLTTLRSAATCPGSRSGRLKTWNDDFRSLVVVVSGFGAFFWGYKRKL